MLTVTYIILFSITFKVTYEINIITTLNHTNVAKRWKPTEVHGEKAQKTDFLFLVSIKRQFQQFAGKVWVWGHYFGGSIIHPRMILSAAHCYDVDNFYFYDFLQKLRAVAGCLVNDVIHTGDPIDVDDQQWRKINLIKVHENFHYPLHDIAIVYVDLPFDSKRIINYKISENAMILRENYMNLRCHRLLKVIESIVSIGKLDSGNANDNLLWVEINVKSKNNCSQVWEMEMNTFVCSDSVINEISVDNSGNALVCNDESPFKDLTRTIGDNLLVGIVSGQNSDKTPLYTRVEPYQKWIEDNYISQSSGSRLNGFQISVIMPFVIKFFSCTCSGCIY